MSVLQELGCRHGQGLAFAQPLDEFRLRRALIRRLYPLPRPLGAISARRAYLSAPDPRAGGCGDAAPSRAAHHHGAQEPPEHRALNGSGLNGPGLNAPGLNTPGLNSPGQGSIVGPHGETAIPPA